MNVNESKQYITDSMILNINDAMSAKELTQSKLAKMIGKSEAWVSKLIHGKQHSMDAGTFRKMEVALGIETFTLSKTGNVSMLAAKIAEMVDANPNFAKAVLALKDAWELNSSSPRPRGSGNRSVKPNIANTRRA